MWSCTVSGLVYCSRRQCFRNRNLQTVLILRKYSPYMHACSCASHAECGSSTYTHVVHYYDTFAHAYCNMSNVYIIPIGLNSSNSCSWFNSIALHACMRCQKPVYGEGLQCTFCMYRYMLYRNQLPAGRNL